MLADEIAERFGIDVAEVERYEGLLATLEARRLRLAKRWARKSRAVPKAIARDFATAAFVASVRHHMDMTGLGTSPSSPDNDMGGETGRSRFNERRDAGKALAVLALERWLADHPETRDQWSALATAAEAEAAAEGVAQATALLHDAGYLPKDFTLDLDELYRDTLTHLRSLDSYGSEAPEWLSEQLSGLAGDMGRVIADSIDRNLGPEEMARAVNAVIAKGAGVQAYMDEAINVAMKRAQLSQMTSGGVDLFDYIAMPGACPSCQLNEEGSPYQLGSLPEPPVHFGCRCSTAPAGTL